MAEFNSSYLPKSGRKNTLGKRNLSMMALQPQNSVNQRSRLGKRNSRNFTSSSVSIPSVKKGVKKCLFRGRDIENHDPHLGGELDLHHTSTAETPLQHLYPKTNERSDKDDFRSKKSFSMFNLSSNSRKLDLSPWESQNKTSYGVRNQRNERQFNLTKNRKFLSSSTSSLIMENLTPIQAEYSDVSKKRNEDMTSPFETCMDKSYFENNSTKNSTFMELEYHNSSFVNTSTLPHRYMQYTSNGLKKPETPPSRYDTHMKKVIEKNLMDFQSSKLSEAYSKKVVRQSINPFLDSNPPKVLLNGINEERVDKCDGSPFIENDSTIIKSTTVYSSSKKKLSEIPEEETMTSWIENDTIVEENDKTLLTKFDPSTDVTNHIGQTETRDSINKNDDIKSELTNIRSMVNNFIKEKELFDKKQNKLYEFFDSVLKLKKEQEESNHKLDNYLTDITKKIDDLSTKFSVKIPQEINMLSQNLNETLNLKNSTGVNTSKATETSNQIKRLSHVPSFSTENHENLTSSHSFAVKKPTKNYTELRSVYSCLKSPDQKKSTRHLRQSTCYTPHSLSICVEDQIRDIFGSG